MLGSEVVSRGIVISLRSITLMGSITLSACATWQTQSASPEQVLATQHPAKVRVQRVDSSSVVLDSPRIVSDTLVGAVDRKRTGVPLAHIAYVAVKHGNWALTTALVLGILVLGIVGLSAVG
jgi:hypothetical protein